MFDGDRSKFPEIKDGKAVIDLDSQKFLKVWQGPQHPGVTGNMALELTVSGDEVVNLKTHVGYLHRGFEKLLERQLLDNFQGQEEVIMKIITFADKLLKGINKNIKQETDLIESLIVVLGCKL